MLTDQKMVILERESARQAGDYITADTARIGLRAQGVELEDTAFGTRFYKIPKKS